MAVTLWETATLQHPVPRGETAATAGDAPHSAICGDVVPLDLPAARVYAALAARLAADEQPIGAHDLLIAATALAHGSTVLTDNLRDFERVPGLSVR